MDGKDGLDSVRAFLSIMPHGCKIFPLGLLGVGFLDFGHLAFSCQFFCVFMIPLEALVCK